MTNKLYTHIWQYKGDSAPEYDAGDTPTPVQERFLSAARQMMKHGWSYKRTIIYDPETDIINTEVWTDLLCI